MRAGEVELKRVYPRRLRALDDLHPRILVVFLHDRGDDDAAGVFVLELLELIDPDLERAVGDQLDVLPAINLLRFLGTQTGIARRNVDDFRSIETDGLGHHRAPAFIERLADDVSIGPRWAGADDEWVGQFQAIDGGG